MSAPTLSVSLGQSYLPVLDGVSDGLRLGGHERLTNFAKATLGFVVEKPHGREQLL